MLSSLVLSGVETFNKLISLSFLELLQLRKEAFSRHWNAFFRGNKVASQTLLKITNEALLRCLFTIFMRFVSLGSNKSTLKELKQRKFVSFPTIPSSYDYDLTNILNSYNG